MTVYYDSILKEMEILNKKYSNNPNKRKAFENAITKALNATEMVNGKEQAKYDDEFKKALIRNLSGCGWGLGHTPPQGIKQKSPLYSKWSKNAVEVLNAAKMAMDEAEQSKKVTAAPTPTPTPRVGRRSAVLGRSSALGDKAPVATSPLPKITPPSPPANADAPLAAAFAAPVSTEGHNPFKKTNKPDKPSNLHFVITPNDKTPETEPASALTPEEPVVQIHQGLSVMQAAQEFLKQDKIERAENEQRKNDKIKNIIYGNLLVFNANELGSDGSYIQALKEFDKIKQSIMVKDPLMSLIRKINEKEDDLGSVENLEHLKEFIDALLNIPNSVENTSLPFQKLIDEMILKTNSLLYDIRVELIENGIPEEDSVFSLLPSSTPLNRQQSASAQQSNLSPTPEKPMANQSFFSTKSDINLQAFKTALGHKIGRYRTDQKTITIEEDTLLRTLSDLLNADVNAEAITLKLNEKDLLKSIPQNCLLTTLVSDIKKDWEKVQQRIPSSTPSYVPSLNSVASVRASTSSMPQSKVMTQKQIISSGNIKTFIANLKIYDRDRKKHFGKSSKRAEQLKKVHNVLSGLNSELISHSGDENWMKSDTSNTLILDLQAVRDSIQGEHRYSRRDVSSLEKIVNTILETLEVETKEEQAQARGNKKLKR